MARSILKPLRLSDNNVLDLSDILQSEINTYRANPQAVFSNEYCAWLSTVAGLGYTAVLTDEFNYSSQKEYSNYLSCYASVRKSRPSMFSVSDANVISQNLSRMVQLALRAFYALNYPTYYDCFIEALRQLTCRAILRDTSDSAFKKKAFRIVELINHL